jgi:hypothetical protein
MKSRQLRVKRGHYFATQLKVNVFLSINEKSGSTFYMHWSTLVFTSVGSCGLKNRKHSIFLDLKFSSQKV